MHLLLPPSEGKTSGGRGRPLGRRNADGPLAAARAATISALLELTRGDPDRAAVALLPPPGLAARALATDAAVLTSPTTPALRRYAGVVFDGFDHASLTTAEQRLAGRTALIFSGLFGVVRGDEAIPDYRVPGKAVLPGLGTASTFWRPVLDAALPALLGRGLVVDLRSVDYAAMWRPRPTDAGRVVAVRVLSPAPRGGHAVISHHSKFGKGRLWRALIRRSAAGHPVDSVYDVVAAWATCSSGGHEIRPGAVDVYTA